MLRLLLLLFFLPALAAAPPKADVDAAISRSVAWLRSEQKGNGAFGSNAGEAALSLMALRHSGVPAADRACTRAARYLERALPDGTVYGAALGVLALLAQSPERHREKIEQLVRHLESGQCRNGQWTYAYRATHRKTAGDNSNTQIAVLALAAARVRRVAVDKKAFELCGGFFTGSQNPDGGFGYAHNQRKRSYGSMTAGGAMALTLCLGKDHVAARRALDWLATEFDPAKNRGAAAAFGKKKGKRGDSFWMHYWLWSLERACAAAGVTRLGEHDWYAKGARLLLDTQQKDGRWRGPERPIQATCFALLFLSRSTTRVLTPRDKDVAATTPR